MSGRRAERVGRRVVQVLAEIVGQQVADPRLALLTFTSAQVTDDLRHVRVSWSVLGDEQARREAARGLARARGFLRREMTRALALRYSPELRFEYDESLVRAERIESLLAGDEAGTAAGPAPAGGDDEEDGGGG